MAMRYVVLALLGLELCAASNLAAGPSVTAGIESGAVREPERKVSGKRLVSKRDPRIRIEFTRPVEYVGADRWVLYDVADCEVHVFVEADANKEIKRLYWIQFEGYIPSVDNRYDYNSPERVNLGGLEFFADGGLHGRDDPYRRPGSDREHVVQMLTAKGYRLPAEAMSQRFVHLTDETKRKELMIIYAEDLALAGYTLADIGKGGKAADKWPEIQNALRERAVAGIKISR